MNIIESAEQAGIDMSLWNMGSGSLAFVEGVHGIPRAELERFAQVIRNQALEDAAVLFPQPHVEYFGREIQDAIRAMKKEQPNG